MKKTLIIILLISPYIHASNAPFTTVINKYREAFEDLEPHLRSIHYRTWTEHCGNTTTTYHDYWCPSFEVTKLFTAYQEAYETLPPAIYKHAAGEGIIVGALAACGIRALALNRLAKLPAILGIMASYATIITRYRKTTPCPYLETNLTKRENRFSLFHALTDGTLSVLAGSASYFCTHCALERLITGWGPL